MLLPPPPPTHKISSYATYNYRREKGKIQQYAMHAATLVLLHHMNTDNKFCENTFLHNMCDVLDVIRPCFKNRISHIFGVDHWWKSQVVQMHCLQANKTVNFFILAWRPNLSLHLLVLSKRKLWIFQRVFASFNVFFLMFSLHFLGLPHLLGNIFGWTRFV